MVSMPMFTRRNPTDCLTTLPRDVLIARISLSHTTDGCPTLHAIWANPWPFQHRYWLRKPHLGDIYIIIYIIIYVYINIWILILLIYWYLFFSTTNQFREAFGKGNLRATDATVGSMKIGWWVFSHHWFSGLFMTWGCGKYILSYFIIFYMAWGCGKYVQGAPPHLQLRLASPHYVYRYIMDYHGISTKNHRTHQLNQHQFRYNGGHDLAKGLPRFFGSWQ